MLNEILEAISSVIFGEIPRRIPGRKPVVTSWYTSLIPWKKKWEASGGTLKVIPKRNYLRNGCRDSWRDFWNNLLKMTAEISAELAGKMKFLKMSLSKFRRVLWRSFWVIFGQFVEKPLKEFWKESLIQFLIITCRNFRRTKKYSLENHWRIPWKTWFFKQFLEEK